MPKADEAARAAAREREGQLTKPAGSPGGSRRFPSGWRSRDARLHVDRPLVAVFAAIGVAAQGVPLPASVTQAMAANFTGGAAINGSAGHLISLIKCTTGLESRPGI